MLPDVDSLALFVQAAELRSLTKAAEASHLGLAAASRRIAMLEARFKTTLLDRSPKGVEPTAAGASLLKNAKAMLVIMNQMMSEMGDHAVGRRGALRIMANTSAMTESLPDDLASFTKAHPDVRLAVEERWSAEIVRAVNAGEADVGIVVGGTQTDGLDTYTYRTDRLAVVIPAQHPLAVKPDIAFVDVLDHDIIALESGSTMMKLLAEQAVVAERTLQLRIQVRSFEAVCRMVQAGLGIGVLPFEAAASLNMGLIVRRLPESWAEREMLVCVKKDRAINTSLMKLVDHLASSALTAEAGSEGRH